MYSEEEIIKGCQKGKKLFQYELVNRYSGMLMTVCRRYVRDNSSAKDVLQNALIRIFKHINKYKASGSFEAWIKRIAVNCALDWIGKKSFKLETQVDVFPNSRSLEPDIFGQLQIEEIIKLVQSLSPSLRIVFNLNIIEGYSHVEIAEMLDISESTSRANLLRARRKLQQKIDANYLKKTRSA